MPEDNLCSECYGAKLSLMQQSTYSAYGEIHAEILAYINERESSQFTPSVYHPLYLVSDFRLPHRLRGDTSDRATALTDSGPRYRAI